MSSFHSAEVTKSGLMTRVQEFFLFLRVIGLFFLLVPALSSQEAFKPQQKRPITVADAVEMTRLEDTSFISGNSSVAHFSPDGTKFVVVLRKGNIKRKTNDFSLLLYKTAEALHSPEPELLLKMSSSSIRDAITRIRWLPDNETLVFLGENPGEKPQVYTFNLNSKQLKKLTDHPNTIYDYAITDDGRELVFRAASPSMDAAYPEQSPVKEVVIDGQELVSLLEGDYSQPEGQHIFCQVSEGPARRIPVKAGYFIPWGMLSLSPNGRYVIFPVIPRIPPEQWLSYRDEYDRLQQIFAARLNKHQILPILQYLFADTKDMSLSTLVDAPMIGPAPLYWAKDSTSIFLSSYLPLDVSDPAERQARERNQYPIQVSLPSKEYRKVAREEFPTNRVQQPSINLIQEQDVNTPQKLYVSDLDKKRKELLLDLNPQFSELAFGLVKVVEWESDGVKVMGGLYFPPDYKPGKKYPLVIQTHGFQPKEFSMDGLSEWTSGYAARPLAAKGILVLQLQSFKNPQDHDNVPNNRKLGATAKESVKNWTAHVYEGAIESLDKEGLIDRNRVGIIGFSYTVCVVGYVLTHSQYRFAAASLVDGVSCGYFEEIENSGAPADFNAINGNAAPFGEGLKSWMKNSPGFNLDKVQTPVRLVALGNFSILSQWEWYVGLTFQKKPVDFVLIPHGTHLGGMVSERMLEQQGLVDWFCFWLKNEEDPDPAKSNQYSRWRSLRKLQQQSQK